MLGETLVQKKFVSQKDLYEGLVAQMTVDHAQPVPGFRRRDLFRERGRFFEDGLEQKMSLRR